MIATEQVTKTEHPLMTYRDSRGELMPNSLILRV